MKEFILMSGRVKGSGWNIRMRVTKTGGFQSKGSLEILGVLSDAILKRKHIRQKAKRKRSLGFHRISYEHENCVWHHVDRNDVVATPEMIHRIFSHCLANGSALKLEGVLG